MSVAVLRSGGLVLLEDGLHGDQEVDLVADQEASTVHRDVEVDAPLLAGDGRGALEAGAGAAPRVGLDAEELDVQGDRLGDALDGEVTGHEEPLAAVLDDGAGEGHRAIVLHVEEVAGAQVRVAVLVAGVDRVEVDGGGRDGVLAGDDLALELLEEATDLAHQVAGGEADLRVAGVDAPGAGRDVGALQYVDAHAILQGVSCWFNCSSTVAGVRLIFNYRSGNLVPMTVDLSDVSWLDQEQQRSWRAFLVATTLLMDPRDRGPRAQHPLSPPADENLGPPFRGGGGRAGGGGAAGPVRPSPPPPTPPR